MRLKRTSSDETASFCVAALTADSMATPRTNEAGTETSSPSQATSVRRVSKSAQPSTPPHMLDAGRAEDSAWQPRRHPKHVEAGAVSPEWTVAGSTWKMAGRGPKAPETSPSGVLPLRLEGRFDALGSGSDSDTPSHIENEDESSNLGRELSQSQGGAILDVDEGFQYVGERIDSPEPGERPVDLQWCWGSLVKWRSPDHPGVFEFDFGIVSRMSADRKWIKRDDRPWREGKISIYTGERHVWAHPDDLILLPPGSSVPRGLTHGAASPAPSPEPQSPPTANLWGWLEGTGLLEADCLELPVPQACLPHLIGKKGKTIRHLEDRLGVVLGVTDGPGGCALVSVVGPLARLELARRVVEIVSKGVNSLLDRLQWPPSPG